MVALPAQRASARTTTRKSDCMNESDVTGRSADGTGSGPAADRESDAKTLKSQQHHTIPRWFLEHFTDPDGMLHVARKSPRTSFRSKPGKAFRKKDYYAAKEVGESLELESLAQMENLFLPCVKNVLRAANTAINENRLPDIESIQDDIQACGLFLLHLVYRSPQRLGDDFFAGIGMIQNELRSVGKEISVSMREEGMQLVQSGEIVILFSQVKTPNFIIGNCGPFLSQDTELGVDNERRRGNDLNWIPAEQRAWMALSPEVALGVAIRQTDATIQLDLLPDSKQSANWVDHFNELCAIHSSMIAGASETSVRAASQRGWPMDG